MAITFPCAFCGSKLRAPEHRAGNKKARCPVCGGRNKVPDDSAEVAALLAPPAQLEDGFMLPELPSEEDEDFRIPVEDEDSNPEAFGDLIDSRINRWGLSDSDFSNDLDRVRHLAKSDPDMALAKCRQVLESCMNALHHSHGSDPGTKRLEQLISEAGRQGMVPRKVLALSEVVRELGNVGTHPVLDDEKLTHREAQIAILSLTIILEWYIRNIQQGSDIVRID